MFLILTRNFPPEIGGMQNLMHGLTKSLSKLNIEQIIPIIASCNYYIGNDTGFGHLAANLNLK